ncbi:hypothetical protein KL942_001249 [Ogataea angusta]|uniref:DNA damage-inducible protein 1 n=1 Tax=Pichia angusta TaxID=870730 RepID=A0ABQ7S119_PICAN|nr:hypothetical protein KL943_002727 [Ogataea angusta]KAG7841370.1 hypothetical protein KL942_001249 [Ogataea angusta]KAG7851053.1 hypothetical protein KL940_001630 [Ogataea angusta]
MNLTIAVEDTDQIITADLPEELEFADFKAYLKSESNIDENLQVLVFDGKQLDLSKNGTLKDLGLKDDDLLILKKSVPAQQPQLGFLDAQLETVRQQYLSNPQIQSQLDPETRAALHNPARFRELALKMVENQRQLQADHQKELAQLYSNPDDPESQKKIMELINQEAIEENLRTAMEISPESFTSVHMLYINCEVNGTPVKAFVDSGAQTTIISPSLAEKTGLTRLIDKRFIGEARGVGSTKILGRIHSAPLKIENGYFPCTFTVIDTHVEMLLGLDMLRRYQANIDLKRNQLVIDDVSTSFLPEHECPSMVEQAVPSSQLGGNIFNLADAQKATKKPKVATPKSSADPAKVDQLVAMGFDRKQAELALQQTNNNVEMAAGMLFD